VAIQRRRPRRAVGAAECAARRVLARSGARLRWMATNTCGASMRIVALQGCGSYFLERWNN